MREIVAIQLGDYSNYVGCHWLNLQDACFSYNPNFVPEINNDVLFREGLNNKGEVTYTPRLLTVGLKGSLGHLPDGGNYYDTVDSQSEIASFSEMKVEPNFEEVSYPKNEFLRDLESIHHASLSSACESGDMPILKSYYDLDGSINSWTDYLIPRLHSRSINLLKNVNIKKGEENFGTYAEGLMSWTGAFCDDFTDRMRQYLEECDTLQGFHVISDLENGFSGLSVKCHEHIRDECPKTTVLCVMPIMGSDPESESKTQMNRILNLSLGISTCSGLSDVIVPVGVVRTFLSSNQEVRHFSNVKLNYLLKYQTSALIAAGLETATVPYRLRNSNMYMKDALNSINILGRTICGLGMSLPFPMERNTHFVSTLERFNSQLFNSLTPHVDMLEDYVLVQNITARGIKDQELGGKVFHSEEGSFDCRTIKECLQIFCKLRSLATHSNVATIDQSLRCPSTFPNFLNDTYSLTDLSGTIGKVAEYRALAGFHNTDEMKTSLEELYIKSKQINPRRLVSHTSCALENDELTETLEKLKFLSMNYSKTWEL